MADNLLSEGMITMTRFEYVTQHKNILTASGINWSDYYNLTKEQAETLDSMLKEDHLRHSVEGPHIGLTCISLSALLCHAKHYIRGEETVLSSGSTHCELIVDNDGPQWDTMGSFERDWWINEIKEALAGKHNGIGKEWQKSLLPSFEAVPDRQDLETYSIHWHHFSD